MSGKLLLQLLSICLLALAFNEQGLKASSFHRGSNRGLEPNEAVYRALVTGDKQGVPKSIIVSMKNFGLMHLLTPSGLHLGSVLVLFKFFPKARFIVTLFLFAVSSFFPGLLALKRMLIFHSVNYFIKNTKQSFFVALALALLVGNFSESPVSFCFTLLFWGTIVFHNGGKWSLAVNLFAMQSASAMLLGQSINLAALVLNPAITALVTTFFPALLICFPLELSRQVALLAIDAFIWLIGLLEHLSFLNVSAASALLFVLLISQKRKAPPIVLALLVATDLGQTLELKRKNSSTHYPLPVQREFLELRNKKLEFIDRRCTWLLNGQVYCKKKPSEYGGPSL